MPIRPQDTGRRPALLPATAVIVLFGALVLGAMGSARAAPIPAGLAGPTTVLAEPVDTGPKPWAKAAPFALPAAALPGSADPRLESLMIAWLGPLALLGVLLGAEFRTTRRHRRRLPVVPGPGVPLGTEARTDGGGRAAGGQEIGPRWRRRPASQAILGSTGACLIVALVLLVAGTMAQAQESDPRYGGLTVRERGTEAGFVPAPTLGMEIEASVTGMIARITVTQTYRNSSGLWLEGSYVFPLPDEAAVDSLRMQIGERVVIGRIDRRQAAREAYGEAAAQGRRASLVEEQRRNVFRAQLANIAPGESIRVEIGYQTRVRFDQGDFRLRIPLVITPRYHPDDAGRLLLAALGLPTPGGGERVDVAIRDAAAGTGNPVALRIDLNPGFDLGRVESSYHRIAVAPDGEGRHAIALAGDATPADRDFELVWSPADPMAVRAAGFVETLGGRGHALVMIAPPPALAGDAPVPPREIIFVLDKSGSMSGAPIRQAKAAVLDALGRLRVGDRFNLIVFDNTARQLFSGARPVEPAALAAARQWLGGIGGDGGTEMLAALTLALGPTAPEGMLRQIVFVTDGAVDNEAELFEQIALRLGDSRLFTVGIGSAPNGWFMRKAAEQGHGGYTFIGDAAEVEVKMAGLFAKLGAPVLRDIAVRFEGGAGIEALPGEIPDLYAGEPLVLALRAESLPRAAVVAGTGIDGPWERRIDLAEAGDAPGVAKLWAQRRIEAIGDSAHDGGAAEAIEAAITDTALAYALTSPFTSLVAIEETVARPEDATLHSHDVAQNLPHGMVRPKAAFGAAHQAFAPPQRAAQVQPVAAVIGVRSVKGATPAALSLIAGLSLLALGAAFVLAARRRR